jgi:hypothetical protein
MPDLLPFVDARIEKLRGRFVVEVGERQAWPFITLCDNRSPPATELRLYIDTAFRLEPGAHVYDDGDTHRAVGGLLDLNNRTVTDVETSEGNDLTLRFDGGERSLRIAGTGAGFTTHDTWWLADT